MSLLVEEEVVFVVVLYGLLEYNVDGGPPGGFE